MQSHQRRHLDARESPATIVAERLVALGGDVRAADPHLAKDFDITGVTRVEVTAEELAAAEVVVVLTDHDAFDRDLVAANARYVFDTRHWLTRSFGEVEYL